MALKPLLALVFFVGVNLLARGVMWLIPPGKLRDKLLTPIPGSKQPGRHS